MNLRKIFVPVVIGSIGFNGDDAGAIRLEDRQGSQDNSLFLRLNDGTTQDALAERSCLGQFWTAEDAGLDDVNFSAGFDTRVFCDTHFERFIRRCRQLGDRREVGIPGLRVAFDGVNLFLAPTQGLTPQRNLAVAFPDHLLGRTCQRREPVALNI